MIDFKSKAKQRFGDFPFGELDDNTSLALAKWVARGSCRKFQDKAIDEALISALCAVALSSPSKSDLQQRDIIIVDDQSLRESLGALLGGSDWAAQAPVFLVFCGNNSRQRQLHDRHAITFANDHLDPLFNAIGDAAIALSTFVAAAETIGLGTCPISQIRNHPEAVNELLSLPDFVFPFAGLVVGWPADGRVEISPRLSLQTTVHHNRFDDTGLEKQISEYDARRRLQQPYEKQRHVELFGESDSYCWSEEKARHYSQSERAGFGAYLRRKGFRLE